MENELTRQRSMLIILIAACRTALATFEEADNVVDRTLVLDLRRMIERAEAELQALIRRIAGAAGG